MILRGPASRSWHAPAPPPMEINWPNLAFQLVLVRGTESHRVELLTVLVTRVSSQRRLRRLNPRRESEWCLSWLAILRYQTIEESDLVLLLISDAAMAANHEKVFSKLKKVRGSGVIAVGLRVLDHLFCIQSGKAVGQGHVSSDVLLRWDVFRVRHGLYAVKVRGRRIRSPRPRDGVRWWLWGRTAARQGHVCV